MEGIEKSRWVAIIASGLISLVMEGNEFIVLPGDCFRCEDTPAGVRVAQVIRVINDHSLAVYFWQQDPEQCYYLPTVLCRNEEGVMDKPTTLSSLVFVYFASDILSYSKIYTAGQTNIYCFKEVPIPLYSPTLQSISCLAAEGVGRLATELQKILCNKRQNQSSYSKSNVPANRIVWMYLKDYLGLDEAHLMTTVTSQVSRSKDLSIIKVKKRIPCVAIRVEIVHALRLLMSMAGDIAAVGIRKRIPGFDGRLGPNDNILCERIGIHLLDNINLVDVISNNDRPQRPRNGRFQLNANGYQGIDFFFFPELSCIRITVRYSCFVAKDAEEKLVQLGIIQRSNRRRLTDAELDLL
jgi:hypothetical protein